MTVRGSLTDLAVAISARNGPVIVTLRCSGILAQQAADDPLRLGRLADSGTVDVQPRREFAGEVAVEADDHRLEAQVPQGVEGDIAHGAEVGLVDDAVVSERAAAGPRIEPPADDPPAVLVEDHRQDAVEGAGGVELLEAERLRRRCGRRGPTTSNVSRLAVGRAKFSTVS